MGVPRRHRARRAGHVGGLPDIRTFLLPRADYVDRRRLVHRGAGRHRQPGHRRRRRVRARAPHVAVRAAHHRRLGRASEATPAPLFHVPFAAIFVNCLAAPAIGNARAALGSRHRAQQGEGRDGRGPGRDPLDPWLRKMVAEGVADIAAITLQRRHDLNEMMRRPRPASEGPARTARALSLERGARRRASRPMCWTGLFNAGGGHGIYLSSPDQRAFRDGRVMAVHAYTHREKAADVYSRVALGLHGEGLLALMDNQLRQDFARREGIGVLSDAIRREAADALAKAEAIGRRSCA